MILFRKVINVDLDLDIIEAKMLSMRLPGFYKDELSLREWLIKVSTKGTLISAIEDNKLVGLLGFYANDMATKKAFLTLIVVDEEHQGTGLGSRLFNKFVSMSRDAGMAVCELNVVKTNVKAILFYERKGLTVDGQGNDTHHYKMVGPLEKNV